MQELFLSLVLTENKKCLVQRFVIRDSVFSGLVILGAVIFGVIDP